jgi:hypothetical protein
METETQQTDATLSGFQATQQKTEQLLMLNKVTAKDIENLNELERNCLTEKCTHTLAQLTGAERDQFLDKIEQIMAPVTKAEIWERNHTAISRAISDYIQQYGSMPSKSIIAEQTGLSRPTVAKHFANYKKQPEFIAQMEQFEFMTHKVLANVYKYAVKGDMRAARIYFEMVGGLSPQSSNTIVNAQNNYIQINNTILSHDVIKQLSAEQLNQIESIITRQRH